jgi:protoporphyrinogen oxidase
MIPEMLLGAPAAYIYYAQKLQKISETILHNLPLLTARLQTELSQQLVKEALLEDQLGTIIQKMIVAKAPSCFITPYGRGFFG